MKIILVIDNKPCEFYASVTARKGRDAYALKKKIVASLTENNSEYTSEIMDDMTAFVVEAFDRQFTAQQFLDGYQGWFFDCQQIIDAIMNDVTEALNQGFPPKNQEPKPEK